MPTQEVLERFIARVEANAHAEAIEEFYTPDASMRENGARPRVGRDALIANERAVLARAAAVSSRCIRPALLQGAHSAIRWVFEFDWRDGSRTVMEEVAMQRWQGDRIVEETFFYDPTQLAPKKPA